MKNTRIHLAEQRAELLARAASQREELAQAFSGMHRPLALVDKGLNALRYVGQHPALIAGVVAVALVLRPKRWLMLLENGWLVWRMGLSAKRRIEG